MVHVLQIDRAILLALMVTQPSTNQASLNKNQVANEFKKEHARDFSEKYKKFEENPQHGPAMARKFIIMLILISSLFVMKAFGESYVDVSVIEAKSMIEVKPGLVILDVRNQSEYDAGHIGNATLIPVWQLSSRLNQLDKADEILVYCRAGVRSANASQILVSNGFLYVYNMLGGINAWTAAGFTVYVKYSSLQGGIDNATDGATLNISSGIYYEHLSINKSLTLNGENKYKTVVKGGGNGTVVDVAADNVTITGFTMQDSGCACADYAGVYIRTDHQNVNLTNNRIIQDGYGVKLVEAQNVTIDQNEMTYNTAAIEMFLSSNNTITENNITNNSNGIEFIPSSDNIIQRNNITNNMIHDIMFHSSDRNTVVENKLTDSEYGIRLYSSSSNNTFSQNTIANNIIGIDIQNSTDNKIYQNSFTDNGQHVQFSELGLTANTWDNGNITGGNYWNNYTGVDTNHDGMGDSPQILDANNQDNYPLMGAFSTFTTSQDKEIGITSNSTVEDIQYFSSNNTIRMQVTNTTDDQQYGFCRLTIPHSLLPPPYAVTVNNSITNYTTVFENETMSIIYMGYQHSTLEILIVPESSLLALFLILGGATILSLMTHRRKRKRIDSESNLADCENHTP